MREEKDKLFYITHSGELLIWLIIILAVVSFSSITSMWAEKHDENDYQIFLQDVDGLIVGSPVRMLGIEVGHVTKIKPTNEEVYVKFILTNPDVYIPQGTKATVEFSGMAGSKSLELYPPDKTTYIDKSTPILTVTPPKRLHDAIGLLNEMFKKLGSIIYTTSSFGDKLNLGEFETKNIRQTEEEVQKFLDYSNTFLDDSNKKVDDMRKSIDSATKGRYENARKNAK